MGTKVEGYKHIEYPQTVTEVKSALKHSFIRLLWELFDSEKGEEFGFSTE